ncbi:MAG: PD-(D/E)XK nuclease family protein [Candidatus Omnitrophota bacterium]
MNRVLTYNLDDDFISGIGEFIEENYLRKGKDLSKLALVFGGKRPGLFLKRELANRIKKGFIPPRIFSMDEFVEYLFAKRVNFMNINPLDGAYIIYELAQKITPQILTKRDKFYQFLPWAEEILYFFEQLDLEKIEDFSLRNIELKAELGYDVPEDVNKLLENILLLRKAYLDYLERENLYSKGRIYFLTAQYINEIDLSEFEDILFCGLFYLHKTELEIVRNIYAKGKAFLFFQGDMEEWGSLKRIARELSITIKPPRRDNPDFKLSIQAGFDTHSEVCLVREFVKNLDKLDNTAIVLPQPSSLIPLINEITAFVKDYNVSLGYPLRRSALYALFKRIFQTQKTRKNGLYYTPDYLLLLSHPLIKNLSIEENPMFTRILIHKLEEVLRGEGESRGGRLFVRLTEIENSSQIYKITLETIKGMGLSVDWYKLRGILKKIHEFFFNLWEEFDNFKIFSCNLEKFMDFLLQYSSLDDYPLNLKMAERVFEIIEEFKNARFSNVYFPQEEVFRIFQQRLDNEFVSFSGSPLKGLQILGLLETRALTFESVVVIDVNEAVLPNLRIYEPLIPREVMIGLGINRLEKEEEIQYYYFKRIISSAKNVLLIYQQREDKERSRFIEGLIWERQKKLIDKEIPAVLTASFELCILPEKTEIKKKNEVIDFLKKMEYSSSSLNLYLHCPLRFYYQYVLGLEEKEDIFDEPENVDIGRFIHELLEDTFVNFIGREVVIDKEFRTYFTSVLEKRFAEVFSNRMNSDAFLLEEILKFRMNNFLDNESKREVKEIVCLEKKFRGDIKLNGIRLKFQAIVDRIDKLSDGSLLILDYKTGTTNLMPQSIEKIESGGFTRRSLKKTLRSFQLPLYLYLVDNRKPYKKERTNAGLYSLRDFTKNQGISLLIEEKELENKANIMKVYHKALEAILKEILDPMVPFQADDEEPYQCAYCPFTYLCK